MPIYEYECAQCGKTSEVIQKFSDLALSQCPSCSGGPITKLVSRTAFHLKGSGWYATDYKKTSKPDKPATEPKAESKPTNECSGACSTKKEKVDEKV